MGNTDFTIENLIIMTDMREELEDRASKILNKISKISGMNYYDSICEINVEDERIHVKTLENRGGCRDYEDYYFPVDYLFNPQWESEYKSDWDAEKIRRESVEQLKAQEALKSAEAQELAVFNRLKVKFEPEQRAE